MLEKFVLTILELNWNQRLGQKKTELNICHHMLTSSTQLQNRSFHVIERTRTSTKCQKMKNGRAKCEKILFFIVKYGNLWGFCCRLRRGCLSFLLSRSARPLRSYKLAILANSITINLILIGHYRSLLQECNSKWKLASFTCTIMRRTHHLVQKFNLCWGSNGPFAQRNVDK